MVGAYQEILGDMHNLFGDTDSVHVELMPNGKYQLVQPRRGDTVDSVLRYVNFEPQELIADYRAKVERALRSARKTARPILPNCRKD